MSLGAEWIFHPFLSGEDVYCDFYDTFIYREGCPAHLLLRIPARQSAPIFGTHLSPKTKNPLDKPLQFLHNGTDKHMKENAL